MKFRLTFSKPVVEHYFRGEENANMKVRIEDGTASFLPVIDGEERDVLPLKLGRRGGAEAIVEGTRSEELADVLSNENSPFFMLERTKGGWLTATPWTKTDEQPKVGMHVRIWHADRDHKAETPDWSGLSVSDLMAKVRETQQIISSYKAKGPGRPPKEISEANRTMKEIKKLLAELGIAAPKRQRGRPPKAKIAPKHVAPVRTKPVARPVIAARPINTNFSVTFVGAKKTKKPIHHHA